MEHRIQTKTATKLLQISKVSRDNPSYKFTSLASMLEKEYLLESYACLNKSRSSGVDGVSIEQYGENLEDNLRNLISRMKSMLYRPQNIRRVYIPKSSGGRRPLGIPAVEDRIVQAAIAGILEAIFEPNFIEESYGFRHGRGCHDALKRLDDEIWHQPINYVIEADIKGFFDNVDHKWMTEFIRHRVSDLKLVRLIVRFLKSGIIEEGKTMKTEKGTPQGGNLSPILANIYLHYVLDIWFKRRLKKELDGYAEIVRYADDFMIVVEKQSDCQTILAALKERLSKFGLELSEEKTKVIRFGKSATKGSNDNNKAGTFDFLGFTHYCGKTRRGKFMVCRKTSKKRFNQKLKAMNEYLKKIRNQVALPILWETFKSKLIGHYRYYGISGNFRSIQNYYRKVIELIFKWLNRRSQRRSFTWNNFNKYLKSYPLPNPKIYVNIYTKLQPN